MIQRREHRAAFGRERRRLRLEVIDGQTELVCVAPGSRDVDGICLAGVAIAKGLAGRDVNLVRIGLVAVAAARDHLAAVGPQHRAYVELLRAVAAHLACDLQVVADLDRALVPAERRETRDARRLQLPVLLNAGYRRVQAIPDMGVRPPDLRDLAAELRRLVRVELGCERMMRHRRPRQYHHHDAEPGPTHTNPRKAHCA